MIATLTCGLPHLCVASPASESKKPARDTKAPVDPGRERAAKRQKERPLSTTSAPGGAGVAASDAPASSSTSAAAGTATSSTDRTDNAESDTRSSQP